jgi:ATP-dependent helicase/nuclease subunit B
MQLVHRWALQLGTAIVRYENGAVVTDGREPLLVAQAPAQAWHLAGDLASLIDELIVEGVDWDRLQDLAPESFDRYWKITIDFLKIASQAWPIIRDEKKLVDPAMRQQMLIDHEIARLAKADPRQPVIAIGSTGTNSATARLLSAIAKLENGAVVLPGLDKQMDDITWSLIGGDAGQKFEPAGGHPQAALHRLLPVLDVQRKGVFELGKPEDALQKRMELLTQAFRPADTTEHWQSWLAEPARGDDLSKALADITMIVASDEREEALALAVAMRKALHDSKDGTAALVTPDRALARRVRAELKRWNIEIDDSGGEPLSSSPYGVLARLALACVGEACKPVEWLALLAHPLVRLGFQRAELERLSRLLELGVLRGVATDRNKMDEMLANARVTAADKHAHPAVQRIGDADWAALSALVQRLCEALASIQTLKAAAPLKEHIAAHRACLDKLTQVADGEGLSLDESFGTFEQVFGELAAKSTEDPLLRADDYATLADFIMREAIVRGPARAHPRLKILGLLEARLIHADLMLLAGLDEAIWPPQVETGPFLNRPMRAELRLTPPERRIGQTAHDFVQALGTRNVILSRAAKRGGSPTVPSRFLQRLEALAGDHFAPARKKGEALLALVRRLDRPEKSEPVGRPEPCPDIDLRPTTLSVTEIETFRRDPYSIYARHILKILPLEKLGAVPGAREAGTQLHDLFAEFVQQHPTGALPPDSLDQLRALAREKLASLLADPNYRAFNWPRIEAGLEGWLTWESTRRASLVESQVERYGVLPITLTDGSTFELRGKADRIDRTDDGMAEIVDYKSGEISTKKMIKAGFAPQLPLEVKMVEAGAFKDVGHLDVRNALHVKVGGKDAVKSEPIADAGDFRDVVERNFAGLVELLDQFRKPETFYPPRPHPQYTSRFGVYDHLARVKEWSAGAGEDGGDA